ncbi:MAG: hypothetical protein ACI9FB_004645 [Candidatus Azotimanducaceae bacterium]
MALRVSRFIVLIIQNSLNYHLGSVILDEAMVPK